MKTILTNMEDNLYNFRKYNDVLSQKVLLSKEFIKSLMLPHCSDLDDKWINIDNIVNDIYNRSTIELSLNDIYYLISDHCASLMTYHPDYNKIASRISVERLHKATPENYKEVIHYLYYNYDDKDEHHPLITKNMYDIVQQNYEKIQNVLDFNNDYKFDYFGLRTLERSYLFRIHNTNVKEKKGEKKGQIIERPQHLIMRVALGIHGENLDDAFETYKLISHKYFTQATPTLFNAGTNRPQLSSCFLFTFEDNIEQIFETISDVAFISKWAGGIGISLTPIRAKGSLIRGTNGTSDGIIPLCTMINKLGKYINQGGKRNGSIATFIEPWHSDIYDFCELRKNTGDENLRARDLFLGLWVPDLFMKRVLEDGVWSLMCPDECPGLIDAVGDDFEKLYTKYENEKKYKRQVRAINLWYHIMECQIETGIPYMLFKDHANRKSNQQNLGTIRSSNLCCEIIEYTSKDEQAVCNLASICLPSFLKYVDGKYEYDYDKLQYVTRVIVRNLNKIIDINYYPTSKTSNSNLKHRPIGIGVQGLADLFNKLELPFGSDESKLLNKKIFETIYYSCVDESCKLAKLYGKYSSFENSPFSRGELQWHLWGLKESDLLMGFDWKTLIEDVKKYGTRNSLLTTIMPTASTAQIMGCSEAIEPYMSNIFTRATLAGEFPVINENLINTLIKNNLWSESMRKKIVLHMGSIQKIKEIPQYIKETYKTAFEIYQKDIITLSSERGPFIDQSQSLNLFMDQSNFDVLSNCHIYSWESGLKTGMYYLRSKPGVNPTQFGIDAEELNILMEETNVNDNFITINNLENEIQQPIEIVKVCPRKKRGVDLQNCDVCSA